MRIKLDDWTLDYMMKWFLKKKKKKRFLKKRLHDETLISYVNIVRGYLFIYFHVTHDIASLR